MLVFARVEKERDDASLEPVQLKRLGLCAYDNFFTDFEDKINGVVILHNALQDALINLKAASALATSSDAAHVLDLEVTADGVRSTPQLLLDVVYAESGSRPLPLEMRHLLASRSAVAEADRSLAQAVSGLAESLHAHAAVPVRLSYNDERQQLTATVPAAGPGAHAAGQQLQQATARVSAALAELRKAAPGLRVQVQVLPTPAPGARTFAWRVVPLQAATVHPEGSEARASACRPVVGPLQLAASYGAAAILEAAAAVAQQAAAVAAATAVMPHIQLRTAGKQRITAEVAPEPPPTPPPPLSPQGAPRFADGGIAVRSVTALRSILSFNAGAAVAAATAAAAASEAPGGAARGTSGIGGSVGSPVKSGIAAAAQADEVWAALRRAVSSANHALFRLAKSLMASTGGAASSGEATMHCGEASGPVMVRAVRLVVDSTVRATQQAAGDAGDCAAAAITTTAAAPADDRPTLRSTFADRISRRALRVVSGGKSSVDMAETRGRSGDGDNCHVAPPSAAPAYHIPSRPLSELLIIDPRVRVVSDNGSVTSSMRGSVVGGAPSAGLSSYGASFGRDAGAEGVATPGWSWSWEWGIQPLVEGVVFPDCLPQRVRAVYDSVNAAVDAARAATDALPLLQREVAALVEAAEAVFGSNDAQLTAAAGDMMAAGRARAALDRNANTITASPALLGLLQAAAARTRDELRAAAEDARALADGSGGNGAGGGGSGGRGLGGQLAGISASRRSSGSASYASSGVPAKGTMAAATAATQASAEVAEAEATHDTYACVSADPREQEQLPAKGHIDNPVASGEDAGMGGATAASQSDMSSEGADSGSLANGVQLQGGPDNALGACGDCSAVTPGIATGGYGSDADGSHADLGRGADGADGSSGERVTDAGDGDDACSSAHSRASPNAAADASALRRRMVLPPLPPGLTGSVTHMEATRVPSASGASVTSSSSRPRLRPLPHGAGSRESLSGS